MTGIVFVILFVLLKKKPELRESIYIVIVSFHFHCSIK